MSLADSVSRSRRMLQLVAVAALGVGLAPGLANASPPSKSFAFSLASYEVTEGPGATATIQISRNTSKGPGSVQFSTSDGTAIANDGDYSSTSQTVSFRSGQASKTVNVFVGVDGNPGESDETVNLSLSNPSRGYTTGSGRTLTIHEEPGPDAPANLNASAQGPFEIDLSWDGVSGDVDHYVVLRSDTSGGSYTDIAHTSDTSYQDTDVTPGTTYYYVVEAVNSDNGASNDSNEASDSTPAGTELLTNGGFESGDFTDWTTGTDINCVGSGGCDTSGSLIPDPSIDDTVQHSGSYSAFIGDAPNCTTEGNGSAFVYRDVAVPATGTTTLHFFYLGQSSDSSTYDGQQVYVEDTSGTVLDAVLDGDDADATWKPVTFDLTPHAGETVRLLFRVYEDGFGDCTSMNLDDVSVING